MFTQAQVEYIQRQFARGVQEADIRKKLSGAGWESDDINDGIKEVARLVALNAPLTPPKETAAEGVVIPGEVAMPIATTQAASHGSKLTLILVIVGIVLVLGAGGFVYMKFIRVPTPSESILLPQQQSTTTEAVNEQNPLEETPTENPTTLGEVQPPEIFNAPAPAPVVPVPVATATAPVAPTTPIVSPTTSPASLPSGTTTNTSL